MKKSISQIICFISGFVLASTASVLAASYTATENVFPIVANGTKTDIESYNINGNTYFKLRDLGELMSFSVGFENNTIYIGKKMPMENETGAIEISLNNSGKKSKSGFGIYTDSHNNEYYKMKDLNSVVMRMNETEFGMWVIAYTQDQTYWRIEYTDVTDDYMWENDLVYGLNGGRLYISSGDWFVKSDEFEKLAPEIGLVNGKPNDKFKITT